MSAEEHRARCAQCGSDLRCKNSRPHDGYRLRRYQCVQCAERVTTAEVPIPGDFNDKAGKDYATSRVLQHFLRSASTTLLLNEVKRRSEHA